MVIMNNDACVKSINNWRREEKNHPHFCVFAGDREYYDWGWFREEKKKNMLLHAAFRQLGFDDVAKQNDMKFKDSPKPANKEVSFFSTVDVQCCCAHHITDF